MRYGGSRENRMRFALEVAETVRAAWPQDRPLFFRVSAVDGKGGLWGLDDTVALAHELRARDVDLVDCSSGGIGGDSDMALVPRVPGYQVPYASRVRRETGIMTMAVGLITEPLAGGGGAGRGPCRSGGDGARTDDPRGLAVARGEGTARRRTTT